MEALKYLHKSTSPQKALPSRGENLGSFCSVPPPPSSVSAKTLLTTLKYWRSLLQKRRGRYVFSVFWASWTLGTHKLDTKLFFFRLLFFLLLFWDKDASSSFFVLPNFLTTSFYSLLHIAWQPSKSPRCVAAKWPATSQKYFRERCDHWLLWQCLVGEAPRHRKHPIPASLQTPAGCL